MQSGGSGNTAEVAPAIAQDPGPPGGPREQPGSGPDSEGGAGQSLGLQREALHPLGCARAAVGRWWEQSDGAVGRQGAAGGAGGRQGARTHSGGCSARGRFWRPHTGGRAARTKLGGQLGEGAAAHKRVSLMRVDEAHGVWGCGAAAPLQVRGGPHPPSQPSPAPTCGADARPGMAAEEGGRGRGGVVRGTCRCAPQTIVSCFAALGSLFFGGVATCRFATCPCRGVRAAPPQQFLAFSLLQTMS